MLLKLLPDQIAKYWPYVKYALEDSLPQGMPVNYNSILEALLVNKMQVWMCTIDQETFIGCAVTAIFIDDFIGNKFLRISCVYGYQDVPPGEWNSAMDTLTDYAKAQGCHRIEAYTDNSIMLGLGRKQGFKSDTHLYKDI